MNNKKCVPRVRKAKMALTTAIIKLYSKRHKITHKINAQSNEIKTKKPYIYSVSQNPPPLRFSGIFSQTVRNFLSKFHMPVTRSYLR